jgi:hypothetical protein
VQYEISPTNGHRHPRLSPHEAAQSELAEICGGIAVTPLALIEETLRHAIPFVREKIDLGLVDKAEAVD